MRCDYDSSTLTDLSGAELSLFFWSFLGGMCRPVCGVCWVAAELLSVGTECSMVAWQDVKL